MKLKSTPLPNNLTAQDLIKGECKIPDSLTHFLRSLICGNNPRTLKSCNCSRKVDSIAQDLIYAVNSGKIKTSKHITLGMTLKSITSSRKVIDIINKYGHCCSYNTIEELETEATFTSCEKSMICPEDIRLSPDHCTGVAFDNYDRFVETCSGKDTLHDTVGIIYQNVVNNDSENVLICQFPIVREPPLKRRRTFDAISPELINYAKKPKMIEKLLPIDSELRKINSNSHTFYEKLDILWVLSHYLKIPKTPMWVEFNSKLVSDNSIKQKVSYLNPINHSPTNISVVYETMRQSQKIAEELRQTYMQVTYDLAIAKISLQLQSTEHPQFDNLFIHLGPFHIQLAYFKGVGKFIDESGLTHLMVESELLASGSLNGNILIDVSACIH